MKNINPIYLKVIYAILTLTALVMASGAGETWPIP